MSSKKDQLRPEYPADLIRSGARGKEFAWNTPTGLGSFWVDSLLPRHRKT